LQNLLVVDWRFVFHVDKNHRASPSLRLVISRRRWGRRRRRSRGFVVSLYEPQPVNICPAVTMWTRVEEKVTG